jgi:hypothetical protein
MIFGFSDSGRALCIEFYAYDSLYLDERQYLLMERDWHCPPIDTRVTCERQEERVFIHIEGDDQAGGSAMHRAYDYELTHHFQLIPSLSEFEWKK